MQKGLLKLTAALALLASQSNGEVRAQTLDPTFAAIDLRQPASITDALQQPDGKIVAVGTFTQANGTAALGLARLNPDGTLDQAFSTAVASQVAPDKVRRFANGQLLLMGNTAQVGGNSLPTVVKLNADGTVAPGFARGTSSRSVTDAIIQPDNKVLLCGQFADFNGVASAGLVRLNADGTVDQAFSTALGAGFLQTNGYPVQAPSIALQADGKILMGGYFQNYQGTGRSGLVRLNADGTLDTTYTPTFFTSSTFPNPFIYTVAIDPRTGYALVHGSRVAQGQSIVRLNLTGQKDATFQNAGSLNCESSATLAVDATGRVLFSGCFTNFSSALLMRLLPDGTVDTQFAVLKQLDDRVSVARPLADGTVLVGGSFGRYGSTRNVSLLRVSNTGQAVAGFLPQLTVPGAIGALAVQPDGKVLVGGRFSQLNGAPANNLARLTAAGAVDPTFNTTGTDGTVRKLLVQSTGRIVAAGAFQVAGTRTSPYIARLLADGTADNTFTSAGVATNYFSMDGLEALSEQPDGSFIVAGPSISFNGLAGPLHRLLATGSADATYAGNIGSATSSTLLSVASLPDGRHYVGGDFTTFNQVAANQMVRLNANGTRDASFLPTAQQRPGYVSALLPLPTGQVLVGGSGFTGYNPAVVRLTSVGTLDATPASGGSVRAMARYANGRVLLAGSYVSVGTAAAGSLVRLNPDLSYDGSFANIFPTAAYLSALALQADEAIVVAGDFARVGSTNRAFLARLTAPNVLGVSARQPEPATEAWPVPAHGQLHLKLAAAARPRGVVLADALGRPVLHQSINGQENVTLNTAELLPGMYLLRVEYASGTVTRRVVVE